MVFAGNADGAQLRTNGSAYRRRGPEGTLLHAIVRAQLKTFLAQVEQGGDGAGLPRFVVSEFERYLACGDGSLTPSGAFAAHPRQRLRPRALRSVRRRDAGRVLVQGPRFLPFLHDPPHARDGNASAGPVLPRVPMRQWVLSLPRWARFLLVRDPQLITRTLALALRTIFTVQCRRGRRADAKAPEPLRSASCSASAVHSTSTCTSTAWFRMAYWSKSDKASVSSPCRARPRTRSGMCWGASPDECANSCDRERTPPTVTHATRTRSPPRKPTRWARSEDGHPMGAGRTDCLRRGIFVGCRRAPPRERSRRPCSSLRVRRRPPLVQTRLSQLADGRLAYLLKRPLADRTEVLVLKPCEFLRRLAALVPPPRAHLGATTEHSLPLPHGAAGSCPRRSRPDLASRSVLTNRNRRPSRCRRDVLIRALRGPNLLLRVFRDDVLVCCAAAAASSSPSSPRRRVVTEILEHLGLRTTRHRSQRRALPHRTRTRPGRPTCPRCSAACTERAGRVRSNALN
jgi:hypothetical protein